MVRVRVDLLTLVLSAPRSGDWANGLTVCLMSASEKVVNSFIVLSEWAGDWSSSASSSTPWYRNLFAEYSLSLHILKKNTKFLEDNKKMFLSSARIDFAVRVPLVGPYTFLVRSYTFFRSNHKYYNFLDCDWLKKLLFPTNSLVKLLSDSLLSDTLLSDSLLSESSISQLHSKL